ncbi:MAG: STAS domain-containing protein [Leptospiraceae bacterium]|nr:STAS domain-containing protein [Leptospiraceae bacterium]
MNLTFKKHDDIIIVYLSGTLDTKLSREVEEDLEQLLHQYPKSDILVNLKDLKYLSSSGLRIFVSLRSAMQESGKNLKLCSIGRAVREVFELTKVAQFFKIYEDEESALDEEGSEDDSKD